MTAKTAAKIADLAVQRSNSKSQAVRNNLTRQIDRLCQRDVIVPALKPAPKPAKPAKVAPKPVAKVRWQDAPASATQIGRIRTKEAKLGLDLTPKNGAGMTGQDAREWNAALNTKLGWTK